MNTNLALEEDDIFCGDAFVMTLDKFKTLNISIDNGRLFINHTFVRDFGNKEEANIAIKEFIQELEEEDIDIVLTVS